MKNKIIFLSLLLFTTLTLTAQSKIREISRNWMDFSKKINMQISKPKKFKLTADAKVITTDSLGYSYLWVSSKNKDNESPYRNIGYVYIDSNEWKNYSAEGTIHNSVESIKFGGGISNDGQFFFDNIKLFIEDENGVMKPYNIINGDFEEKINDNKSIPKWDGSTSRNQPVKIKEYNFSSHIEDDNISLLVTGTNTISTPPVTISAHGTDSPLIESMISMLDDVKDRIVREVSNLKLKHVDHLHDEKANRIGALIMHLAAAEVLYQVSTFENRDFNDEEKEKWYIALHLGPKARKKFKGKEIDYYLDIYNRVREKTKKELRKRTDIWFASANKRSWGSNQWRWYRVIKHQSSHLGQILLLKKRLPPLN